MTASQCWTMSSFTLEQITDTWAAGAVGNLGRPLGGRSFPRRCFPAPISPRGGARVPSPTPPAEGGDAVRSRTRRRSSGLRIRMRRTASHRLVEGRGGKGSNTSGDVLKSLNILRKFDKGLPPFPPEHPVGLAFGD